jgi:hypothetical protein
MTVELSSPKFNEIIHNYDRTARLLVSDLAATFPDDTVTRWQKIFLDHAQHDFWDRPPQPKPMKNNPRKLDWTSVWEWKQKHPGITDEKIAELLHYNRVTITRKLNEFAKDK